jgi:hypothetical protein
VSARPQLHLVDAHTGEIVPQRDDDRDILIEEQQAKLTAAHLQIGKLKKELRDLRAVEPEALVIKDVLDYWRERCKPTATIAVGGKRWEKVRGRMKDNLDRGHPFTPAELKLAVDGALLDPWLSGRDRKSKGYLDAETIFRDAEMVERLLSLAVGFEANAGVGLGELLEVADEMLFVGWPMLLEQCTCSHRRIAHTQRDRHAEGRSPCIECEECLDFDHDWCAPFNVRREEQRRRRAA